MNSRHKITKIFTVLFLMAVSSNAQAQTLFKSIPLRLNDRYANYFTNEELNAAEVVIFTHSRSAHKHWKRSASLPVKMQVYEKDSVTGMPGNPMGSEIWVENCPCRAKVKVDLSGTGIEKWPEEGCFIAVEFMSLQWYQQHGYYNDSNYFYWEKYNIEGVGKRWNKTYVFPQWKCDLSEYVMYSFFNNNAWTPERFGSQYRILKLK